MRRQLLVALVLVVVCAAQAAAQQPGQPGQPGAPPNAATTQQQGAQAGQLDQAIAACLLLGNQEEIVVAELAERHAKHEEVKQFAQQMIEDHRRALEKIRQQYPQLASVGQQLGAAGGATAPGETTVAQSPRPGQPGQPGQPTAGQDPMFHQMLGLQTTIAQQCLELTRQELEQAEDFDTAYMGQQVGAHLGMLAKLKGSEQFASAKLKPVLQELTQTVEQHFEHAKKIKTALKDKPSDGRQARTGAASERRQ
jgi:predicted outer membrane protein